MTHPEAIRALIEEINTVATLNRGPEQSHKQSESDDLQHALLKILARVRSIGTDPVTSQSTKVQILRNVLTQNLALLESGGQAGSSAFRPDYETSLMQSRFVLDDTAALESPAASLV